MYKTFLEGTFICTPSFLVCARLTTCVHAHSLEGTLVVTSKYRVYYLVLISFETEGYQWVIHSVDQQILFKFQT